MASIPLPALDVRQQQPQENQLDQIARLMQVRNQMQMAPLQQQAMQQQIQSGQLQLQQQQMDIAARNALNQAYAGAISKDDQGNTTFDEGKMRNSLMSGPAAFQTPSVMKGLMDFKKSQIDFQGSVSDLQTKQQNMVGNAANAIKASGYNPAVAHALLDQFPQTPQMQQIRGAIDNPDTLKQWTDTAIAQSSEQQKLQNAKDVAALRANTPEMQGMNAWLSQNPGKTAADYQQHKVDMQTQADVTRETNPQVINAKVAEHAREQAITQSLTQGDPNAAGALLANGTLSPNELKSRGLTPDFIVKATQAAQKIDPSYNPQQAEAQFDVAKSPANVAFFGSAGSLVSKGGTLDQLAVAGKDLPGGKLPAFNSIADWEKAATGSGPVAKYASIALGAADDYAKVMGGGQGSDTSRLQALNLFKQNMSPEQRAASIEGVRGSVNSQAVSRIGDNKTLKGMYGSQFTGGANAGGAQPGPGTPKTGGIAVGSVITQGGHRYKVTAVDQNGKATAADPIP